LIRGGEFLDPLDGESADVIEIRGANQKVEPAFVFEEMEWIDGERFDAVAGKRW